MAERVGFEPTVPLRAQRFSRPSQSTTLAPLRERAPGGAADEARALLSIVFGVNASFLASGALLPT